MKVIRTLFLATGLAVGLACASIGTGTSPSHAVEIVGVTVIDPASSAPPAANQTILIVDGVIRSITPTGTVASARNATRIDGRGKFAIPGLWDAHVHFMNTGVTALPLLVANGVTSVREMGGFLDSTRAWQARMRAGTLVGPRIITPGPILESPAYLARVVERSKRGSPELARRILPYRIGISDTLDAKRAVDSLAKLGVDFIKIRNSGNALAFEATIREAHRAGLRVAAHQMSFMSVRSALNAGQDDLEHMMLPPLTNVGDALRDSVYRTFVEHHAFYTPTLSVSGTLTLSGDSAQRAIFSDDAMRLDERRPYASAYLLGWWRMQVDERLNDTTPPNVAALQAAYRSSAADVHRMHELGVTIMAGTDAGSVLVYPGFSLHEELARLVEDAGLTPRAALIAATIAPARFARIDDRVGALRPGQVADIVLLDADPLVNIRNTRRIAAVIQAGRVFTSAELNEILANVRRDAREH